MNLRTKTLLITTVAFLSIFLAVSMTLDYIVSNAFLKLEEEEVQGRVQQINSALTNEIADIDSLTTDWAKRDDTYTFIQDGNQTYINSNLSDDSFYHNRLNLAVYLDSSGNVAFSKGYSLTQNRETAVPESLLKYLNSGSPLLNPTNSKADGFLVLPEAPLIVASKQILPSDGNEPSRGTLLLGRYIDETEIQHVASMVHLPFKVFRLEGNSFPDIQKAAASLVQKRGTFVQPLNSDTVAGYYLFDDIYQKPAFIVRIDSLRSIYLEGKNTVMYFRLALLVIGLLSASMVMSFSEGLVVSRVVNLSTSVSRIGTETDTGIRVVIPGNDEISGLAKSINGMLERLDIAGRDIRLRAQLLDAATDSITLRELNNGTAGKPIYVNRASYGIRGYTREEFLTMDIADYTAPEDLININQRLKLLREKGEATYEVTQRRKDGSSIIVEIHAKVLTLGGKTYMLSVSRDISRRRQMEEEIKASEAKYRDLVENINDVIITIDNEGLVTYVSPAAEKLTRFKVSEITGRHFSDFVPPEDVPAMNEAFGRALSGESVPYEFPMLRKDGSIIYTHVNGQPIIENGKITGLRGLISDITERKKAEEALMESEAKFRNLVENAPVGISTTTFDGRSIERNRAVVEMYGYDSKEEFLKVPVQQRYFDLRDREDFFKQIQEKGMVRGWEVRLRRKDGSIFWASQTVIPQITASGEKQLITITEDINERKHHQEQLEELYRQEKELRQKLEEEIKNRAEYTRALVHELKTPLTPVMASSELLVEELKEDPWRSLAQNISRGAENLNRRINELLDLARGEMGVLQLNPAPVNIARLLEEIVSDSQPVAQNIRQSLELIGTGPIPVVMADEDRLRQVLQNLVGNALKYTPPGGSITIKAGAKDGQIIIEVKDTGHGIDEKDKDLLFQPYHRLERDRERTGGMGLGLYLAKTFIELHGGKIWVESRKGEGSTFAFSIPIKGVEPEKGETGDKP